MTFLQRELDFSEFDSTSEDLLKTWSPIERKIRSHRRLPRFTKTQVCAAFVAFLAALSIGAERDAEPLDNPNLAAALAAPAPPSDTATGTVGVTDRLEIVERRGGTRVSRSQVRGRVREVRRWPVTHWVRPLARTRVTSCYGPRWGTMHRGIDLDGDTGDVIRSVGTGTVVQAGWRYSGLGYSVIVRHGSWLVIYAHASRVLTRVGATVHAGTKIARVGATGNVTGSHLHLALARSSTLRDTWSNIVNPAGWLRDRGIGVACA